MCINSARKTYSPFYISVLNPAELSPEEPISLILALVFLSPLYVPAVPPGTVTPHEKHTAFC